MHRAPRCFVGRVLLGAALGFGPGSAAAPPAGAPLRWGAVEAGPVAVRLSLARGAGVEGTGEAGLAHLVEHLRAAVPRGALPGRAWTEADGLSFGLSVEASDVSAAGGALAAPFGGPISPGALRHERAVIVEEARAQGAEARALGALRAAVFGADHPYARPSIGAPEAPSADVQTASIAAIAGFEARLLKGPRLLLAVGAGAGPEGAPRPPALDSAAVSPGPPRVVPVGRGGWLVWPGPSAASPEAPGLRALAVALRRAGRAALWWAGREGGVFALPLRQARPGRGDRRLLRRLGQGGGPALVIGEDDVMRAKLEQARVAARPDLLAEQAAACWLHGRPLSCGWQDAALGEWGPAALGALAARWLRAP